METKLTNNKKLNLLLPEIEKRIRELFGEKVLKIDYLWNKVKGG